MENLKKSVIETINNDQGGTVLLGLSSSLGSLPKPEYSLKSSVAHIQRSKNQQSFIQLKDRVDRAHSWIQNKCTVCTFKTLYEAFVEEYYINPTMSQKQAFYDLLNENEEENRRYSMFSSVKKIVDDLKSSELIAWKFKVLLLKWAAENKPEVHPEPINLLDAVSGSINFYTNVKAKSNNPEVAGFIISDLEKHLKFLNRTKHLRKNKKKRQRGLKEIFKHYAKECKPSVRNAKIESIESLHMSKESFILFCRDFEILNKGKVSIERAKQIFNTNSSSLKRMNFSHFFDAISDLAVLYFGENNNASSDQVKIRSFYQLMGFTDPSVYVHKFKNFVSNHSVTPQRLQKVKKERTNEELPALKKDRDTPSLHKIIRTRQFSIDSNFKRASPDKSPNFKYANNY